MDHIMGLGNQSESWKIIILSWKFTKYMYYIFLIKFGYSKWHSEKKNSGASQQHAPLLSILGRLVQEPVSCSVGSGQTPLSGLAGLGQHPPDVFLMLFATQ